MKWLKSHKWETSIILTIIVLVFVITVIISVQHYQEQKKLNHYKSEIAHTPVMGSKDAEDTISVYGDFSCPYCRDFELDTLTILKESYVDTDKTKIHFINVGLLGDDSLYKSVASYSLYQHDKDKYWAFHRQLLENQHKENQHKTTINNTSNQRNISQKEAESVINHAKEKEQVNQMLKDVGVSSKDIKQIKEDINNHKSSAWKNAIKDRNLANKHQIKRVPTVCINGEKLSSANDLSVYREYLGR
ncbi:thioredoxin domain-containing protein [Staphylococcus capitis]|uniref:DsbA family protein n=1 Tax=Staphylococcus capitis TaxID=29388 RepID=UPI002481382A|nr:thioredoxin domain-containing protein [Staphylococcus capitis]MDH9600730.1 thioredoxin domain-containing protein [Staphylococcus capitis]MDH9624356.1 thioredoxin domain-containing protein [Staphylococcus capitis]